MLQFWYGPPGDKLGMKKYPVFPVCEKYVVPVSSWIILIVAPFNTSPVFVLMIPFMLPVVVCAATVET
jgi:hypothetical protein